MKTLYVALSLLLLLSTKPVSAYRLPWQTTEVVATTQAPPQPVVSHTSFDATASLLREEQRESLALVREVFAHSAGHPACRTLNDQAEMQRRCTRLTEIDKVALLVAITECHIAKSTHMNVKSCQDLDDEHIEACMRDMNRDTTVFRTYSTFYTRIDWLCEQVDRSFAQRRSADAMNSIFSATVVTAEAMGQLQRETVALTADIQDRMEQSGDAVLSLLTQHTDVEAVRFQQLHSATERLEGGQTELLTTLTRQGTHLQTLLRDSQDMQLLINATSVRIAATQREILSLQEESTDTLVATRDDLLALKRDQAMEFARALGELRQLQALSNALRDAQQLHSAAVDALTAQQQQSFAAAEQRLAQLSFDQVVSFQNAQTSLSDLQALQLGLKSSQADLLQSVRLSAEELTALSVSQRDSFTATGDSLRRIYTQAVELESRLGGMLLELKAAAQQLLELNFDVLRELFQVHSALYYVALLPVAWLVTATDRTRGVRFFLFALLLSALLLEFNLATVISRWFPDHFKQAEFDDLRVYIRYAASVTSLVLLTCSALLYTNIPKLAYELQQRTVTVAENNHRMLHQLMDRTEVLRHRRPPTNNPFQSDQHNSQPEGHPSTDPAESGSQWRDLDVHACCPDQHHKSGILSRFVGSRGSYVDISLLQSTKPQLTELSHPTETTSEPVSTASSSSPLLLVPRPDVDTSRSRSQSRRRSTTTATARSRKKTQKSSTQGVGDDEEAAEPGQKVGVSRATARKSRR